MLVQSDAVSFLAITSTITSFFAVTLDDSPLKVLATQLQMTHALVGCTFDTPIYLLTPTMAHVAKAEEAQHSARLHQ